MRMTVPFSDDVATRWPQGENEIATRLDECAGITVLDDWNKIIIPHSDKDFLKMGEDMKPTKFVASNIWSSPTVEWPGYAR